MASNFAQSFWGGFANQVNDQNNANADMQRKMQEQQQLEAQRKDDDYRNMVLQNTLTSQRETNLVDHKAALDKQNANDDAAAAQQDHSAKVAALFGNTVNATDQNSNGSNNASSNVQSIMQPQQPMQGAPGQSTSPTQGAQATPPAQGQAVQSTFGSNPNVPSGSGAPVQGANLSGNQSQAQATGNNTLPSGQPDNAPAQYAQQSPVANPQTNPESPDVQNQTMNNSASTTGTSLYTPMNFTDKVLAAQGLSTDDNTKQYIQQARSPQQALSPQDRQIYASMVLDTKDTKGAEDFLKNNKQVQAYNVMNGNLADGTHVAPINDSRFAPDLLQLRNPMVNLQAVASDKTQLDKETDRRNQELDPSNPKGGQAVLVNQPKMQAMQALDSLNDQEAINSFINDATGAHAKAAMSKLVTTLTGDNVQVSSANDMMGHLESLQKRDLLNNTKGRITNREFDAMQNMIANAGQTPQGRASIITMMQAQYARQAEVADAYQQYSKVNGTFKGADDVIDKYVAANPVYDFKNFNPSQPQSLINPMAKSFQNWQMERTGQAAPMLNGTATGNLTTQQPMPDTFKSIVYGNVNTNPQAGTPQVQQQAEPQQNKQTQDTMGKFF